MVQSKVTNETLFRLLERGTYLRHHYNNKCDRHYREAEKYIKVTKFNHDFEYTCIRPGLCRN